MRTATQDVVGAALRLPTPPNGPLGLRIVGHLV